MYRFAKAILSDSDKMKIWDRFNVEILAKKDELVHLNLKSYVLKCVKTSVSNKLKHRNGETEFCRFSKLHRNELYKMENQ